MFKKILADRVLIKPDAAESITKGGIIIPDTAKERPLTGKVIQAGPGFTEAPMTVKKGDNILYRKDAGSEVNFKDEVYLIMLERDILAVI